MTVIMHIGRRVPKNWFKRTASKVKGLITFQENIWQMIMQAISLAKRKAQADGRMFWNIEKNRENEDMYYMIEWRKVVIQGTQEMEEDEYKDCLKLYSSLGKTLKKEMPVDDNMRKHFKSKILSGIKVEEAYREGYGSLEDNNISNKLLEMGILTHVEWIKDFDTRPEKFY